MSSFQSANTVSIIFIPGGWHTSFHVGPFIAALRKHRHAELILPSTNNEYDSQTLQALRIWDFAQQKPGDGSQSIFQTHKSEIYQSEADSGREISYRIVPCPLFAAGPKLERRAKFKDDVAAIMDAIVAEASRPGVKNESKICVIAHSAAGIAALEAINQFLATSPYKSQLTNLIAVSAMLSGRNNAARDGVAQGWIDIDAESDLMHIFRADEFFYNDMDAASALPYVDALVPHVMGEAATRQQLMTSEAFRSVPSKTYLVCELDACLPVPFQESEAEQHGMQVVRVDAGHCPFISRPEEFVELVESVLLVS